MIDNSLFFVGKPSPLKDRQFDHSYDWLHLLSTYKKYVNNSMIVLDIGSSSLAKAKILSLYCKKLIGLELFQDRSLANFYNAEFVNGDWQNLSSYFPRDTFDIIMSSHVIEHVRDDVKALNEAFMVLKKGGYVLISTPKRKRLARVFNELFTGKRKFPYWEHEREYVKEDIVKLIKNSYFYKCNYSVRGLTLGLHGGPYWSYLKKFPKFLECFSGFWEVVIQK